MERTSYLNIFVGLVIAVIAFTVYSLSIGFDFVNWDDDVYLYENFQIQSATIEHIVWYFSHSYYYSYIPVTMLSHMLDYTLWQFNPSGHHLTNVILHSVNTFWVLVLGLQVFSIMKRDAVFRGIRELLLGEVDRSILVAAAVSSALYTLHPLRVETVAWISDRKDLLCVFFLLPAAISYVRYAGGRERRKMWYNLSLLLFVLACLSKSIAATAPVVFLFLDRFLLNRPQEGETTRSLLIEKLPFVIVAVLVAVVASFLTPESSSSDMFEILSPVQRLLLPFHNVVFYLIKTFLPLNLSPMYPLAGEGEMMFSFFMFTIVFILCLLFWKKGVKSPMFVFLCFVVMLAPSAGFSSAIIQTTADRYTYLPSVALFLLIGGVAGSLFERFQKRRSNVTAIAGAVLIVAGSLVYQNIRLQRAWMNSETLWGRVIDLYPGMPLPYNNMGLALQARGAVAAAEEAFNRAIELKPNYLEAHLNLGNIMFAKGNWDEAERLFERATYLNPNQAEAFNNLGVVANAKGSTLDALQWFRRSVEVNPDYAQGHFNLGALYAKMGNRDASVEALRKAARLGHRAAQESLRQEGVSW